MNTHFTETQEFQDLLDQAIQAIKERKDKNKELECCNERERNLLNKKLVRMHVEKEVKKDIAENDFFKFNLTSDKKADLKNLIEIVSWKMERMPTNFEG